MSFEQELIARERWEPDPGVCPWCEHELTHATAVPRGFALALGPCLRCANPVAEELGGKLRRATEADLDRLAPEQRLRLAMIMMEARRCVAERRAR